MIMKKLRILFSIGFIFTFIAFIGARKVFANGTDLNISCTLSTCLVLQGDVPFFNELNLVPGKSFTRKLTVTNSSNQIGSFAVEAFNLNESSESALLSEKIIVKIHRSSPIGSVVYGETPKSLHDLVTQGFTKIGDFSANQTDSFYVTATFDPDAGNEYQNLTSTFDMDLGFEFVPVTTPSPTSSSSNNSGNNSGGGTSQASAPVCSDSSPSGTPTLLAATANGSQVTLSWTAAEGADGYAINFGIQPGVYLYGNPNVGNVTSYIVSGLTPGNRYFFQIIPLHGCAAGTRSNELSTNGRLLAAGTAINPPNGFGNSVLGVETEASKEAEQNSENKPEVLGDQTECIPWKVYLPIIFLIIQVVASAIVYAVMRNPQNKVKQLVVIGIILVCAAFFYFFRTCDCAQASFFAILCKWYIVVALALALITQFINYALIEKEQ